jgi:hypothetical protein
MLVNIFFRAKRDDYVSFTGNSVARVSYKFTRGYHLLKRKTTDSFWRIY